MANSYPPGNTRPGHKLAGQFIAPKNLAPDSAADSGVISVEGVRAGRDVKVFIGETHIHEGTTALGPPLRQLPSPPSPSIGRTCWQKFGKSCRSYLLQSGLVLAALYGFKNKANLDMPPLLLWLLVLAPLLWTFLTGLPALWRWWRDRTPPVVPLDDNAEPDYFRLWPYEDNPRDRQLYKRPDGREADIFRWIANTKLPLLVLSGDSGSGKTSLLQASVLPRLRESKNLAEPFFTLTVRSYDDPLKALREELLTPGEDRLWQAVPKAADGWDSRGVVRRAAERAQDKGRRLLFVLDQFEELLLIHEEKPERLTQTGQFLRDHVAEPIPGLIVILCLRRDYDFLLDRLGLPPLEQRRNYETVPPFSREHGRKFLEGDKSGVKLDPAWRDEVLDEAIADDGTRGYIRPILLNFLGRILRRLAGQKPIAFAHGKLLARELRRILGTPGRLRDYASDVLRRMVTDADTKQPVVVGEVSRQSGLTAELIEDCLRQLNEEGLVRRLNREPDVVGRRWEISHDFLARLLGPMVRNPRRSRWQTARPIIAAVTLVGWVSVCVLVWKMNGPENILREQLGLYFGHPATGVITASVGSQVTDKVTEASFARYGTLLARIKGLRGLYIEQCTNFSILTLPKGLARLQLLTLKGCANLESIEITDGLSSLKDLSLKECSSLTNLQLTNGLTSLSKIDLFLCERLTGLHLPDRLTNLSNLDVSFCGSLTNLHLPDGLTNLSTLDLSDCSSLTNLHLPDGLTSLSKLDLSDCSSLTSLHLPDGLTSLSTLRLSQCRSLTSLHLPDGLTSLTNLSLGWCSSLTSLHLPGGLTSLSNLSLGWCSSLTNLHLPDGLTSLSKLDLGSCSSLTSLHLPDGLTNLSTLGLMDCRRLTNLHLPDGLTNLSTLDLMNCRRLTNLHLPDGLRVLYLAGTQVKAWDWLSRLPHLRGLDLTDAALPDDLEVFCSLPELEVLYLGDGVKTRLPDCLREQLDKRVFLGVRDFDERSRALRRILSVAE